MKGINRRQFLGTMAAAGYAAHGLAQPADPPRAVKAGVIGCGWFGNEHLKAAFEIGGVEVLSLCDVDSDHLARTADTVAGRQGNRPRTFKDYRELLDTPGLEVVFIATPPHWHALPFIAACEKGLAIYCEKPLAYDMREGQAMVAAADRHQNIVQIGFQRRQSDTVQAARDHIAGGSAGKVVQADVQIHYTAGRKDRTPTPPPASLDWDLWCGPAPRLPYSEAVGHFHWRLEKAYGNGHLVDWGIHLIDATRVILGERMPTAVQAAGGLCQLGDHITTPDMLTVHFEFATCPVVWRHRIWGAVEYRPEVNNGIFLFCEKETLFVSDTKWMIIPKGKDAEPRVMEARFKDELVRRHVAEFLEAVRSRRPAGVTPLDAWRSTGTVQLAMIAYETGAKIRWDEQRGQIVGHAEAGKLLRRDYRSPWEHPFAG